MTEWLLSGHNTQESIAVAHPLTLTSMEKNLEESIQWFMDNFAGDILNLDPRLRPAQIVQGWIYLNINYTVATALTPVDPGSLGVPQEILDAHPEMFVNTVKLSPLHVPRLLLRLRRLYKDARTFYKQRLSSVEQPMRKLYWDLLANPNIPVEPLWSFLDQHREKTELLGRAHETVSIIMIILQGILQKSAPQLAGLFVGQNTPTSLIGQRIWELRERAAQAGPEVTRLLQAGVTDLETYRARPEAAAFVTGVEAFLHEYGHRGFRYELDFAAERLVKFPQHLLLAIGSQLAATEAPAHRAEMAYQESLHALQTLNPLNRRIWRSLLNFAQRLIAYRENSKNCLSLQSALFGLLIHRFGRYYYPNQPDDIILFYHREEFSQFLENHGEPLVAPEILERRRAEYELHRKQPMPGELVWYNPETYHWRSAYAQPEPMPDAVAPTRFAGIPASAGSGAVEGMALVTSDPLEAGKRLLELQGNVILITRLTDPAWSSLFARLTAVVTELGGVISHAAIVARENGLPAVVGVTNVTQHIRNGQRLRVDGATGNVEILE